MSADGHFELELSIPLDSPDTIDSAFLCRLTSGYLQLLARVAQEQGRNLSFQGLRLEKGSTRALVRPSEPKTAQDAGDEAALYVSGEAEPPPGVAPYAREVINALRAGMPEGLAANVIIGPWRRPLSPRPVEERSFSTEVVSLRCRVLRVGGTRPALRVETASEEVGFTLFLDEHTDPRLLGAQLYEDIDIVATVRRDPEERIVGGTLMEWAPLEAGSGVEAWREWFRRSCPEWEGVENVRRELGRTDKDDEPDDRH